MTARPCAPLRPVTAARLISLLLGAACAPGEKAGSPAAVADRAPGERRARTSTCDPIDPNRCALPFPSSAFVREDPSSETGLRVSIEDPSLPGGEDEARFLNLANGFSRLSPVVTFFAEGVDTAFLDGFAHGDPMPDPPVWLVNAQPDSPGYGSLVPVWMEVVQGELSDGGDLLITYPLVPLEPNAEYAVVVLDSLLDAGGAPLAADGPTRVALGLDPVQTDEDAVLAAHHAPLRQLLGELAVDPARVVRAWDFTTRTTEDVTRRLDAMMAQAVGEMGGVQVTISDFVLRDDPAIAGIVIGELSGVPDFLDENRRFVYDDDGLPIPQGTRTTRWRVALPAGGFESADGPYRIALYGHGTGGSVYDSSFDSEISAEGVAKVNLEFHGWTDADLLYTISDLLAMVRGSEQSTAQLLQAVVDGYALLKAVEGPLGEALAAPTLAGVDNPRAGVLPVTTEPAWVGGSLGGTMGAIIGAAYPEIQYGVLNVPAGAWSHLFADSYMYQSALKGFLIEEYGTELEARFAMSLIQGAWDDVDGAAWADRARADGVSFLLQESIHDPVVPNQGTHVLASALQAQMVGPALRPIPGVEAAERVVGGVGLTQYLVPDEEPLKVHGFAARDTPAALAAMDQILHFMRTAWAGSPEVVLPAGCLERPGGACDFEDAW